MFRENEFLEGGISGCVITPGNRNRQLASRCAVKEFTGDALTISARNQSIVIPERKRVGDGGCDISVGGT